MTDRGTFTAAERAFNDALADYHYERLKRAQRIIQGQREAAQAKAELASLKSRAQRASIEGLGGAPPSRMPARLNREQVETAIAKVNVMLRTDGGFLEKIERRKVGRNGAAYLREALKLFAAEHGVLERAERALIEPLLAEQQAATEAIKDEAEAFRAFAESRVADAGAPARAFTHPSWEEDDWTEGEAIVKLGDVYHWIDGERFTVPYLAKIPGQNVFVWPRWFPERRKDFMNQVLLRAVRAVPPGRVRLLLVDPTSLGNVFSPLLSLGDESEDIITTKVWTTEGDIRARLEEMSDRVGLIIQKYLTDEYETLEDYNNAAGEVAEENVVIAINDFPLGLDQRSIEIVKTLAEVGPRCGVSLVILRADDVPEQHWQLCIDIANLCHRLGHWVVEDTFKSNGHHYLRPTLVNDDLFKEVGVFLDHFEVTPTDNGWSISWTEQQITWIAGSSRGWHMLPPEPWNGLAAERTLHSAGKRFAAGARVEVHLEKVWQLFAETSDGAPAPAAADPATFWHADSRERLLVPVGRHGSRGVSTFSFDSQLQSSALLVGRPGSGKSNLLHVVICTLAARYSPEELELYLLDFKEAVEFAGYASGALPHARAIALESDREFGLAVLRHLSAEIERRGRLFRDRGGEQTNIVSYRAEGNRKLPRILLVIDEFHRLFDREDTLANEAAKHLDDIVRLGRGFGIHSLLASQTLLGMSALGRHTLNQIALRAALQCSDEDSRIIFGEDNPAASLLTRPGEAVKNGSGGRLANNEPFQVPLLPEGNRQELLRTLAQRAQQEAGQLPATRVYRRDRQATWRAPRPEERGGDVALRFGDAVLIEPDMPYMLNREGGKNVLVVGRNEQLAGEMLAAAITDLRLRHDEDVEIVVADLMAIDGPVALAAESIGARVVRRRDVPAAIIELAEIVEAAEPTRERSGPTRVFVVNGLNKARDLDPDDYSDEGQELMKSMMTVVRDGPEVGVHTVVWADSVASVDRRLGRTEREFGGRVVFRMPADDAIRLCDADVASELREREAALVDADRGTLIKFQPFAAPELRRSDEQSVEVETLG